MRTTGRVSGCGYAIPAGANVVVSQYVLHHDAQHWESPEVFDPDRFLPERVSDRVKGAYLPFGGGPRQCIGNNFALMEAQLILAAITQQYCLDLVPGKPVEAEALITLRPKDGPWMTLQRVRVSQ